MRNTEFHTTSRGRGMMMLVVSAFYVTLITILSVMGQRSTCHDDDVSRQFYISFISRIFPRITTCFPTADVR